jgi:hypothetical protein
LLKKHLILIFLFKKEWQRATLLDFDDTTGKTTVFMIDYGDKKEVDANDVRRLPKQFGRLPKMALPCRLRHIRPPEGQDTYSGFVLF